MRRIAAAFVVPLLAIAALAGCGSSSHSSSSTDANTAVSVSGAFGKTPTVKIPAEKATSKLTITTAIKGTGPALASTDDVLANLVIYVWSGKTHKLLDSTFTSIPQVVPASVGLTGLADAMKGQKIGSRILAVVPPKYGYGTSGNSQLGVTGTDTTVWVIDLVKSFSPTQAASGNNVSTGGGSLPSVKAATGAAPTVTVPKNSPPSKLITKTLIKGTGPVVANGQTVVAQYVAVNWRTGKVFSTTWPGTSSAGAPFSFSVGGTGVIPGFSKGLAGIPVGSRVMLVIPPAEGYGKAGQSSAGIKGTDTLVFVVDVLAALPAQTA
jgi:peptidylprolyl isomerase